MSRFRFRFTESYRRAALPFGVTENRAWVDIDDRSIRARYGPWHVESPLANVAGAEITGPYPTTKTIGPPHVSLADRGLTFASNNKRGACITFHNPIAGIDPIGAVRHPGLTLTVDDVDGFVEELRQAVAAARQ